MCARTAPCVTALCVCCVALAYTYLVGRPSQWCGVCPVSASRKIQTNTIQPTQCKVQCERMCAVPYQYQPPRHEVRFRAHDSALVQRLTHAHFGFMFMFGCFSRILFRVFWSSHTGAATVRTVARLDSDGMKTSHHLWRKWS